jgi:hypothetical protein
VAAEKEPTVVVKGIVKVAGRKKVIDGKTYSLVGLREDWAKLLGVGGATDVAEVVNGKVGDRMMRPPSAEDSLRGKGYGGDALVWLRLPERGRLEYLCGVIHGPVGDVKVLERRLRAAGYGPYTIEVSDIPVIEAKTMEDLSKALDRVSPRPATPTNAEPSANR